MGHLRSVSEGMNRMSERYPRAVDCNLTAFVPIECRGPAVRVFADQIRTALSDAA